MAFLATRDGARARAFYADTLGLRVLSDDGFALALDAGGTMLRIQKVDDFTPHPFTALGWEVRDLQATSARWRLRGSPSSVIPGWIRTRAGSGGPRAAPALPGSRTPTATRCPSRS